MARNVKSVGSHGIFALLFSFLLICISDSAPATEWLHITDALFNKVFGAMVIAVIVLMMA